MPDSLLYKACMHKLNNVDHDKVGCSMGHVPVVFLEVLLQVSENSVVVVSWLSVLFSTSGLAALQDETSFGLLKIYLSTRLTILA